MHRGEMGSPLCTAGKMRLNCGLKRVRFLLLDITEQHTVTFSLVGFALLV